MAKQAAPPEFAVITGPIVGEVTLPDGSTLDVSDPVVYCESEEAAKQIAAAIGESYAANGHPTDPTFTYTPPEG